MELARPEAPCIENIFVADADREGWINFDTEFVKYSDKFERPTGENATKGTDIMQIYFTSGTTGMPKMVCHNYFHPLGHIVTAHYWQRVQENKLHMSVSDSGWAKFGWGKIYGQWICGATVFAYDMGKFHANNLLAMIEKYKLTTFCAPPTMYRFMLQEKVEDYDLSSVEHWSTAGEALNPEVFNRLLVIACLANQLTMGLFYANQALGDIKWFSITVSVLRMLSLPISWIFLKLGYPAYSAIVVFVVCESLGAFSRVIILSKLSKELKIKEFLQSILCKVLPPFALGMVVCWAVYASMNSLWSLLVATAASVVVYAAAMFFFGLSKDERSAIVGVAQSFISKFKRQN